MSSFKEDPSKDKITIKFSRNSKARFLQGMNRHGLTATQFLLYLLDSYYGDNIETLRNYRHSIAKRVKRGVDHTYIDELKLIQKLVNTTLENI